MELLKEARAKKGKIEYYIKIFFDNETQKYSVYVNNSNFNWGYQTVFDTFGKAKEDYYNTINLFDFYEWKEIK